MPAPSFLSINLGCRSTDTCIHVTVKIGQPKALEAALAGKCRHHSRWYSVYCSMRGIIRGTPATGHKEVQHMRPMSQSPDAAGSEQVQLVKQGTWKLTSLVLQLHLSLIAPAGMAQEQPITAQYKLKPLQLTSSGVRLSTRSAASAKGVSGAWSAGRLRHARMTSSGLQVAGSVALSV